MKKKDELPACPVATTVQLIGSKWKLLIMRNLLVRPWRFNELQKSLDGISQKVLTDSLRSMEADGIITRTVYPEVPPRVEYALNDLGESMVPCKDKATVYAVIEVDALSCDQLATAAEMCGSCGVDAVLLSAVVGGRVSDQQVQAVKQKGVRTGVYGGVTQSTQDGYSRAGACCFAASASTSTPTLPVMGSAPSTIGNWPDV